MSTDDLLDRRPVQRWGWLWSWLWLWSRARVRDNIRTFWRDMSRRVLIKAGLSRLYCPLCSFLDGVICVLGPVVDQQAMLFALVKPAGQD